MNSNGTPPLPGSLSLKPTYGSSVSSRISLSTRRN